MIGNRKLPNVAPASDAALVPEKMTAQNALDNTLVCLKQAVNNNYVPAFMLIASAGLAMHYETVLSPYGMCPTPVAVGPKNTGKSTAAKSALALLGTPQFFVGDFTATQTSALNSRKTFPSIYDDPSDIGKVKSMIDNSFNAGARCTSRSTTVARSVGIVTINTDRLRALCSNFKESSRVVFIPFEPATIASASESGVAIDDTRLLTALKGSGDAVSLFISLGKLYGCIQR